MLVTEGEQDLSSESSVLQRCEVLLGDGNYSELEELIDSGLNKWSGSLSLLHYRGILKVHLGDLAAAQQDFAKVLELDPNHSETLVLMIRNGLGEIDEGLQRVDSALRAEHLNDRSRTALLYSRAELLDKKGDFDSAWLAFEAANEYDWKTNGTDIHRRIQGARFVIKDVNASVVDMHRGYGNPSEKPIFIVGMPRSGTSLTEQFIGAHPDVWPAGEQVAWGKVMADLVNKAYSKDRGMIEAIAAKGPNVWAAAGDHYLSMLPEGAALAVRVTDKMPGNYGTLPYVPLVFPNARVIHLKRDPLATIFSCVRQHFGQPMLALTVEDWARQYGIYEAMMHQWTAILGDSMMTVQYEDLVNDFPAVSRDVISFLDLPWHPACLEPEKNKRIVRTASMQQVRQPVHTRAVDSWRRYEGFLRPLTAIIDETREKVLSA